VKLDVGTLYPDRVPSTRAPLGTAPNKYCYRTL